MIDEKKKKKKKKKTNFSTLSLTIAHLYGCYLAVDFVTSYRIFISSVFG